MFAYCNNNPVNMFDPDGFWAFALAGGGYLAAAGTVGATNIWNPLGWIIIGTAVITTVVVIGIKIYDSEEASSNNDGNSSDPYARPGQKKQGRERKNKARKSDTWKPRSNPKPPKKHTPGKEHRKYKQ